MDFFSTVPNLNFNICVIPFRAGIRTLIVCVGGGGELVYLPN